MRELKEFAEDLYKCSRCGLCQSVCPVYKTTLSECAVSKGKFNMLNGVLNGDLVVSRQMKKYLDMCTGCNACKNFCPSGIDARKIIAAAKEEYFKHNELSLFEKFLGSYSFLKFLLIISKPCFWLYRFFHISKIIDAFENLLLNLGPFGKKILLMNYFAKNNVPKKTVSNSDALKKAIYFDGCVNRYINPQTENSVFKLLQNAGVNIVKRDFECCGVTFLNDGNIFEFRKVIEKNLAYLNDDFDILLTDCASCNAVLKSYKDYSSDEKAEELYMKAKSLLELIDNMNFYLKKSLKVAIHKPCHEENDFSEFVKRIKGVDYVEVESYDSCCGFSGSFSLKNSKSSLAISKQKAIDYIKSGADIVLTTCPSCLLGLEQGFIETNMHSSRRPKVMNLFVFLADYCNISDSLSFD